jgi:TRAP-type C4-dicarboxylate transport system substrate-binding protein
LTVLSWLRPGLVAVLAGVALLGAGGPARAEPTIWNMASIVPEGSPNAEILGEIARAFEHASGGRLRVRMRFGGVVADEATTLDLCKQGRVHIWAGSMGAASASIPALAVFETPYLFDGVADYERAVRPDVLHQPAVLKAFHAQGLEPFGMAFAGWRDISSTSRPLRLPTDLAGVRVRAQPAPLHRAMWRLLGAKPLETTLSDVETVFVKGQVEAADLPGVYLYATSLIRHIKYLTRTNHMLQGGIILVSREAFLKMPKRVQAALLALRGEFGQKATAVNKQFDDEVFALLKKDGVKVLELSAAERDAWKKALAPLRAEALRIGGPAGAELLRALEKR